MPFARRRFLRLAAAAAAAVIPALPGSAEAVNYPNRPIRLIVGFARGGPNDILGRLMGQWLTTRLGQPVEVENRPGDYGNIATAAVTRAPADGYTLLLVGPSNTISPALNQNLDFDFLRDIAPIAGIVRQPMLMLVHPKVPARNVAEFIAYAKTGAGKFKMASTATGSAQHVAGELFKMLAGIELPDVYYPSSDAALKATISGETQLMFEPMTTTIGPLRAGRLRALAITTTVRSSTMPDLPTLAEFLPGYEASAATGIGAPRRTPSEIIERLNREINLGFVDPGMKQRLVDTGGILLPGAPDDFGRLLAAETEKWASVIKFSDANSK